MPIVYDVSTFICGYEVNQTHMFTFLYLISTYQSNFWGVVIRMTVVEVDSDFEVKLDRMILSLANDTFSSQVRIE